MYILAYKHGHSSHKYVGAIIGLEKWIPKTSRHV